MNFIGAAITQKYVKQTFVSLFLTNTNSENIIHKELEVKGLLKSTASTNVS